MTNLSAACEGRVVAVTLRNPELIRVLEVYGCRIVVNDHAELGMGSSIAAGVAATPDASGWVIALADMPSIQIETVVAVIDALRGGARIAVPTMGGKRGHPVGFSALYRARLQTLTGDIGAREILKADANYVEEIGVDDEGIFSDIDTPADLKL